MMSLKCTACFRVFKALYPFRSGGVSPEDAVRAAEALLVFLAAGGGAWRAQLVAALAAVPEIAAAAGGSGAAAAALQLPSDVEPVAFLVAGAARHKVRGCDDVCRFLGFKIKNEYLLKPCCVAHRQASCFNDANLLIYSCQPSDIAVIIYFMGKYTTTIQVNLRSKVPDRRSGR